MYFKPQFLSLSAPHPLWTTCGSNPWEANEALVVSRMLSGQYISDWHARHWTRENPEGLCLLCPGKGVPGTIQHLLLYCEALQDKRELIISHLRAQSQENDQLQLLLSNIFSSSPEDQVQFLLDPSVTPVVISGCQMNLFCLDDIFNLTRTFCYALHRRRMQMLGRFKSN